MRLYKQEKKCQAEVMSVCFFVCEQHYGQTTHQITTKLGTEVEHVNISSLLTFGDPMSTVNVTKKLGQRSSLPKYFFHNIFFLKNCFHTEKI